VGVLFTAYLKYIYLKSVKAEDALVRGGALGVRFALQRRHFKNRFYF